MIRALRRKFILVALSALMLLLLVLAGSLIVVGYIQMENSADSMLRALAEGMSLPPPVDEIRNPAFGYQISPDPLPMRFLVLHLGADGAVATTEQFGVPEKDQLTLRDACAQIASADGTGGKIGAYKYLVADADGDGLSIAFLDNSIQARMLLDMLATAVIVGAGCMVLMFLIALPVSSRAAKSYVAHLEKQRQFITNAGHELKTPVAIIQSNADAMELIEGGNKYTRNIRGQAERLDQLVKQLLLLARMDEKGAARQLETIDLGELVREETQVFAEPIQQKGIALESAFEGRQFVKGQPEALEQLIHILMDNAVRYTPQRGTIRVSLGEKGHRARLTVSNNTDALPDAPPQALFDRFYRADAARAQGGYGIGLSAAQRIVEMHRGRIEAAYEDGLTVRFSVELPKAARPGAEP